MNVTALATRQSAAPARADAIDTLTVARMLAESGFFGEVRDAGKALAKILAGQELGMGPVASLMGVHYQQGKVAYSANIMAAAVKKSGHYTYRVRRLEDDGCEIEFFERAGSSWEAIGVSEFTKEDADKASLRTGPNKHNWTKFPRNMMFARAMSNGAKWYCADVFCGVTPYTPDELGAEVVITDSGDMQPARLDDVPIVEPDTGPASSPVKDGNAAWGWTSKAEKIWHDLAAEAAGLGIPDLVPTKPEMSASADEIAAAGRQLRAAVAARRHACTAYETLTKQAIDLGMSVETLDPRELAPEALSEHHAALKEIYDRTLLILGPDAVAATDDDIDDSF